jgi:hypothetical protein
MRRNSQEKNRTIHKLDSILSYLDLGDKTEIWIEATKERGREAE